MTDHERRGIMVTLVELSLYLNPPKNTPSIAAGLDGDEFGIVGVSPAINLCYSLHSFLKLKFGGSGRMSAG